MTFQVGDYLAVQMIGPRRSAPVWLGRRLSTGAVVALKIFPAEQISAVRREAALATAVNHPHVLPVLDAVQDQERAALITEHPPGGDLADLLRRRGRLTVGETITVLLPVAAALACAHERQIVHGDISPVNIRFDGSGRPLLAGLGALVAAAEAGLPVSVSPPDAAPEIARGGAPTPATDMFSLGSVALACLVGRPAWPADDLRDVLIQAAAGQWPDPGSAAGPAPLVAAVRALLEHDADRRPDAASLVLDLRTCGRPAALDLRLGRAAPHSEAGAQAGVDSWPAALGSAEPEPGSGGDLRSSDIHAGGPRTGAVSSGDGRSGGRHLRGPAADIAADRRAADLPDRPGIDQRRWAPAVPGLRVAAGSRPVRVDSFRRRWPLHRRAPSGTANRDPRKSADPSATSTAGTTTSSAGTTTSTAGTTMRSGHLVRWGALAACAIVVTVLAGAVGLWWAGADRAEPLAASGAGAGGLGLRTPAVPVAASTGRAAPAVPATRTSLSAPSSTSPPAARPSPAPTQPSSTPRVTPSPQPSPQPPRPPAPSVASRSVASRSVASSSVSSPTVATTDWTATVRVLDAARAQALVSRNAALLDAVYTADSASRAADVRAIQSMLADRLRVSDAHHVMGHAHLLGGSPVRVEVDDSLPSYSVLDDSGRIVGRTSARPSAARVLSLVWTPAGYRISDIRTP